MTPSPKPTPGPCEACEAGRKSGRQIEFTPAGVLAEVKRDHEAHHAIQADLAAKLAEAEELLEEHNGREEFGEEMGGCTDPGGCRAIWRLRADDKKSRHDSDCIFTRTATFLASLRGDPTSPSPPSRSSLRVKLFSAPPRKDPCAVPDCEWNWGLIWAGRPHEGLSHEYRPIPRSEDTPRREASA